MREAEEEIQLRKLDVLLAITVDELSSVIEGVFLRNEDLLEESKANLTSALSMLVDTIILENVKSTAPEVPYTVEISKVTADKPKEPVKIGTQVVNAQDPKAALEQIGEYYRSSMTTKYLFKVVGEGYE